MKPNIDGIILVGGVGFRSSTQPTTKFNKLQIKNMDKARYIGSGSYVFASKMKSRDYDGIFQCPHCKTDLILVEEHKRYGKIVSAFFKHREAENDFQKRCRFRVKTNPNKKDQKIKSKESKEQNLKRLKQNLILSLKERNDIRITDYCQNNTVLFKYIDLFMDLSYKLITATSIDGKPLNGGFILKKSDEIKKYYQSEIDTLTQKINLYNRQIKNLFNSNPQLEDELRNYKSRLFVYNLSINHNHFKMEKPPFNALLEDCIKKEKIIEQLEDKIEFFKVRQNSVGWLLDFLSVQTDCIFIKDFLDYILGEYFCKQNFQVNDICTKVFGFHISFTKELNQINQLFSDIKIINTFFEQKHKQKFSGEYNLFFFALWIYT